MERCRKNHEDCPNRLSKNGCRVILHHIFWPSGLYATEAEARFRNHMINRVPMCEYEEQALHRDTDPPPKPTALLIDYVNSQEALRQELTARPMRRP